MEYFLNSIKDKHIPIVDYFLKYNFGTNLPVLTYLSTLSPFDRCIILEKLFEEGFRNIHLLDKMVLAYVKVGRVNYAKEVIHFANQMSIYNNEISMLVSKLDLPIPQPQTNTNRLIILEEYRISTNDPIELEFIDLLIEFVKKDM